MCEVHSIVGYVVNDFMQFCRTTWSVVTDSYINCIRLLDARMLDAMFDFLLTSEVLFFGQSQFQLCKGLS